MKFVLLITFLFTLVSCASNELKDKTPEQKKADLYYSHGTQALLEKDYTTALAHLQKAAELSPDDSKIQNNLGMALYFKGQAPKAISHIQKAIELDEKNSDARVNLAGIYYAEGRLDLAYQQYTEVSKDLIYAFQFRTYYNMALIKERQGQTQEARQLLTKSLAENKEYCPAHFFEGKMDEKIMNWSSALEHYQDATKGQCYEEPAPHYSQAQMYLKLGRYSQAREKLEMVMEHFSRTPFFAMASQTLSQLRTEAPQNEDKDFLRKARLEMKKLREKNASEPQTYQGTSF